MSFVRIKSGTYNKKPVKNLIFPVVIKWKRTSRGSGKPSYITVNGSKVLGFEKSRIRIYTVPSKFETVSEGDYLKQCTEFTKEKELKKVKPETAEDERIKEIEERFDILQDMTKAMMQKKIRAMIVTGPPGVGKSYGVEQELSKLDMFSDIGGKKRRTEVVKGAMTPLGLYAKLYEFREKGSVLVFDDCDTVLLDGLSLNILKAALDTSTSRKIYWNADSSKLAGERIPNNFEFKGSVCFITNINFENTRGRLKDHLNALMSRCHYLDLTLDTMRDKILRVKQIANKGELFSKKYNFTPKDEEEVLEFMYTNCDELREVSLRMALKIADCKLVNGANWKTYARATCIRR